MRWGSREAGRKGGKEVLPVSKCLIAVSAWQTEPPSVNILMHLEALPGGQNLLTFWAGVVGTFFSRQVRQHVLLQT